jgi:hypothetical protein
VVALKLTRAADFALAAFSASFRDAELPKFCFTPFQQNSSSCFWSIHAGLIRPKTDSENSLDHYTGRRRIPALHGHAPLRPVRPAH